MLGCKVVASVRKADDMSKLVRHRPVRPMLPATQKAPAHSLSREPDHPASWTEMSTLRRLLLPESGHFRPEGHNND